MRTAIRVILGGILAGLAVFFWGFVAHMFTPIGSMGMKAMPQEAALSAMMKTSISDSGFYVFPKPDFEMKLNAEESKTLAEKIAKGPTGILIVQPQGARLALPQQLGFELASNIAAAILAAILLSRTQLPLIGRVLFVTTLGLFGWFSVCASQWTWYAFPTDFTFAALIDEVGGFLVAGIVLALIFRPVPAKLEA